MAAQTGTMMVAAPINLSGVLFNKTKVETPLFNSIPNKMITARTFITGATYDTGYPSGPAAGITETASLTAPDPQYWERENAFNVTQIFHRSVAMSYRKMSNTGDLNNYKKSAAQQPALVGNTNNVPNEMAFQLANTMDSIRLEIENTILNGTFQDSKGVAGTADKTRGLIEAITSNVVAAGNSELTFEVLYDLCEKIAKASSFDLGSYLFICDYTAFKQLQKVVADEGLKIDTTEAGVNVTRVITPFGAIRFLPHRFMPAGTLVAACMPVLGHAMQPVPGKGNFFFEPLDKKGAADSGQIYGQWGLDHGPEFLHAKVTGLATSTAPFTAPKRVVEVINTTEKPVNTKEVGA